MEFHFRPLLFLYICRFCFFVYVPAGMLFSRITIREHSDANIFYHKCHQMQTVSQKKHKKYKKLLFLKKYGIIWVINDYINQHGGSK